MIVVRNVVENGDEFRGVDVVYDPQGQDEGPMVVQVRLNFDHMPLAVDLLEHAIVQMRSRQRAYDSMRDRP